MDVRHLRQILAIRRHGSFAKAAEALGVAQPSLSKAIARLEDELKVQIFERTSQGSELTPVGEIILERAQRVLREMDNLTRDTLLAAGGETGQLRIGVGMALRHNLGQRLLMRLTEAHPGLRLQVETGDGTQLMGKLETRELDLVLVARHPAVERPGMLATRIMTVPPAAFAHPDHPLVGRRRVRVEDLAPYPCWATSSPTFAPQIPGEDDSNLRFYASNDFDLAIPLLRAGRVVVIATALQFHEELAAGRAVRLDLISENIVHLVAVTTRAASYVPIISQVVKYCVEIGEDMEMESRAHEPAFASP